jgi:hypothetical protein
MILALPDEGKEVEHRQGGCSKVWRWWWLMNENGNSTALLVEFPFPGVSDEGGSK